MSQINRENVHYDEEYYRRFARLRSKKPFDDRVITFLQPRPDEKILDVGCGLGYATFEIARRGAKTTGIDISEYAINRARERCEGEGVKNLELHFIVMNALEMDYREEFDKVICDQTLEHFESGDRRVLLEKIRDALKGNGILILGVPVNDFIHHRSVRRFALLFGLRLDPTHRVNFSVDRIRQEVHEAGFRITGALPRFYLEVFGVGLPPKAYSLPIIGKYLVGGINLRCIKHPGDLR